MFASVNVSIVRSCLECWLADQLTVLHVFLFPTIISVPCWTRTYIALQLHTIPNTLLCFSYSSFPIYLTLISILCCLYECCYSVGNLPSSGLSMFMNNNNKQTSWLESASEQYRQSVRRLLAKLVPTLQVECATWSEWRILTPYSRFSRPQPLLFFPSSSSVVLTRLSGPRSKPTAL
jgi:hypothetical protein